MKNESNAYLENKEIPCGRCKSNDSEIICLNCDSQFRYSCLNCDNTIHSLPSKKNHKRSGLSNFDTQQSIKYHRQNPIEKEENDINSDLNFSNKFQKNSYMQSISPIRPNANQVNNNPVFSSIQSNVSTIILINNRSKFLGIILFKRMIPNSIQITLTSFS